MGAHVGQSVNIPGVSKTTIIYVNWSATRSLWYGAPASAATFWDFPIARHKTRSKSLLHAQSSSQHTLSTHTIRRTLKDLSNQNFIIELTSRASHRYFCFWSLGLKMSNYRKRNCLHSWRWRRPSSRKCGWEVGARARIWERLRVRGHARMFLGCGRMLGHFLRSGWMFRHFYSLWL